MKIIGAGIFTEAHAEPAWMARVGQDGARPVMALDYAMEAVARALTQARCQAEALELIVAVSVSPSRLADDPDFSCPRLSHPLQRDLKAVNAVVLDIYDADWSLGLDLAQSFCSALGYRRALLLRTECVDDIIDASSQGLASGAAAIVIACEDEGRFYSQHVDIEHPPLLTLQGLSARTMLDTGCYAKAQGCYDVAAGSFRIRPELIEAPIGHCTEQLPAPFADASRLVYREPWLVNNGPAADTAHASIFDLPGYLAELIEQRDPNDGPTGTLVAFTLDPFKPRVGCFAVEV